MMTMILQIQTEGTVAENRYFIINDSDSTDSTYLFENGILYYVNVNGIRVTSSFITVDNLLTDGNISVVEVDKQYYEVIREIVK